MTAPDQNDDTLKVLNDIILPFLEDGTVIPVISNSFRIEQIFQSDPELRELLKKEAKYYDDASTLEQQLTKLWASKINYPMSDDRNLARVAQYRQVEKQDTELPKIEYLKLINDRLLKLVENDPDYKDKVTELRARTQRLIFTETAQQLEYPRGYPDGRKDPLELLASLDLPIFITTSYSTFLETRLEKVGKTPRTQLCFWDGNKAGINPDHLPDQKFNPTPPNPAVYHLFGMEQYKDTIVLSEDDYMNFLIAATEGFNSPDLYPSPLRLALPTARLILIGYNLRDWDFRALFRFLLMARKTAKKKKSIAIQLRPVLGNQDYQKNSEKYLEQFFDDHDFTVVWNNPDEFIYKLIDAKNSGEELTMNSVIPNPYIGPRTFKEDERDRFFGRDREERDLLALVVSERLVVFYAQSGAGKSSLVNTRLIPELRTRQYRIFTGRVAGDAPEGIKPGNIFVFNLLRSLAVKERNAVSLAAQTISEFLKQQSGGTAEAEDAESNVLIIDQFEEIFSTHHEDWEKREGFFEQLAQALEEDPYLLIVLVMREDYIASLDPFSALVPGRFRRRYYMQRLERDAALDAIRKPVEKIRPFDEDVAERLVNDLSGIKIQKADETTETQPGQFVEGVQLQLVCFKLWNGLGEGDRITHEDLNKVGHVDLALEEHYAERVREVAESKKVSERLIREWFSKILITSSGTRNMVLRKTRTAVGELPDHVIQALQSDLVRAEQRGASAFYELTHDRLVEPILANNKKWFDNLSPLQRQAALWNEQGRNETWLFSDQALAEAEVWAKEHQSELTQSEKDFLKASQTRQKEREKEQQARQRRIITNLSIVAVLITTGLAVFGIVQAQRATKRES